MADDVIYSVTGNPFVNAGSYAIASWLKKKNLSEIYKYDIEDCIHDIIPIYFSENWKKQMYMIFPNSSIVNPSVKNKEERYTGILQKLIEDVQPLRNSGNCIACGRRDADRSLYKSEVPLTGSGKFMNFYSNAANGADYCSACAFAVQFLPLVLKSCGRMLLLLQSNSHKVMKYWANDCIKNVRMQVATGNYTGCADTGYKNPKNALFHITEQLIMEYDERWQDENVSLRLYYFTNYGQGPALDIYDLPTAVFRFLAYIKTHPRRTDWYAIVRRGYHVNWNKIDENDEESYKNRGNDVYENLLSNKSIVRYFINRTKKSVYGNWSLFSYYLKEVRKLDENRINAIRELGDEIASTIKENNDPKRLGQLERAANYNSFRNVLRRLIKDRIAAKTETPLFTFDDYVQNILPEGALGWRETQDLLLFRIYEVLHDWMIEHEIISDEPEDESTID